MANKKLRRLRRKAGGSTTAGRLARAAGLAGVIGGGGYLASRASIPRLPVSSKGFAAIRPAARSGGLSTARSVARATPPVARATPPVARATPPVARATPPVARSTPPRIVVPGPRTVAPELKSKPSKIRRMNRRDKLQSIADGDVPGVSQAGRLKADKMATSADRRLRQPGKTVLPSLRGKTKRKNSSVRPKRPTLGVRRS